MLTFSEEELEQAALQWFSDLQYDVAFGPDIAPDGDYPERLQYSDVILKQRLREALARINKDVPNEALEEALRRVEVPQNPSLLLNNRAFQHMITDGIDVEYRTRDGDVGFARVWLFDFTPDGLDNNDFLVVNQFTVVENGVEKRPDIVVFVNGLPLVVFELKSSSNETVGISDAYCAS